jgi:hypothetical protein
MRRALVPVAVMLVLAGCGSGPESDGSTPFPGPPDVSGTIAETFLQVVVDPRDGTEPETYTLVCDGQGDRTHPDGEAACAHLQGLGDPFAALPDDVVCTEQFGGPQTAHVVGRWDDEPVDLELSRSDGCLIAQWDSLGPLLPIPVGEEPIG